MTVVEAAAPNQSGTNDTAGARRIAAAFARARADGRAALIPYVVAGYPDADTSFEIALAAADAGADLLEVGLPYSDPLADGATLQRASGVALAAGATLERSLRLIERIGAARPDLPLVPMGYANQVIGGGDGEAVAKRLAGAGAAGLIVADLTPDEGAPFEAVARAAGLAVVYLVAPTTPAARRAAIAARSGGFLYCVSLVGVTGARTALPATVGRLVRDVKAVSPVPVAVGFGVSRPAHVRAIARAGADGVIVASALVDALGPDGRDGEPDGRPGRPAGGRDRVVSERIAVTVEATAKKAFATALDWPGWSRAGRTQDLALVALADYAPRYAVVAREAGEAVSPGAYEVVEQTGGGSGTDFGVPSAITELDRRPVGAGEAARLARLVEAAWIVFDRVAGVGAGRAAQGSAGRRPRPRQDGRPRHRGRLVLRPRDRPSPEAARSDGSRGGRGDARGDARGPAPAVGRLAAGRPQVDGPLRRATDRLARARPRLGDGGPRLASRSYVPDTWQIRGR